jgi:hypothetical protein
MLKKIGGVCLSLMLFTTQVAAQTQPQPQRPPGPLPQKTAPRPPAPPPAPATSAYCMFESKEYSIGAVLCVSNHMSQVCTAPDTEHSHSWWSSGPQPLCSSAALSAESPSLTYAPKSTPSPLPSEATPKSTLPSFPSEPTPKSAPPSPPPENPSDKEP